MNHERVMSEVNDLYIVSGHKKPAIFFCDSPMDCLLRRVLLEESITISLMENYWGRVCDQIEYRLLTNFSPAERDDFKKISSHSFRDRFIAQFKDQFRAQFRALLRDQFQKVDDKWFCDQFWGKAAFSMLEQVNAQSDALPDWYGANFTAETETWGEIWHEIRLNYEESWKRLDESFWSVLWEGLSGRFEELQIEYILWYHLRELLGLLIARRLRFLFCEIEINHSDWVSTNRTQGKQLILRGQLAEQAYNQLKDALLVLSDDVLFLGGRYACQAFEGQCGLMFTYKGLAFVSRKADFVKFDNEQRLHCENGYAVQYCDDWGVCVWRGTVVPSEWVIERSLDAKAAITCENMEQRNAACEILGWHNILNALNARIINKHSNPLVGELLEVELPGAGRQRFLKVMCGTAREFALPVPPNMKRASQAQAWLNFTTEDTFMPQVRT